MLLPFSNAPKPVRKFLYLPDGWDDIWRSAKATNTTTNAWLTVIGDSIAQGKSCSDIMSKSWYELMKATLKTNYPVMGDFYLCAQSLQFFIGGGTTANGTPPWVIGSGYNVDLTDEYGACFYWTGNAGVLATFTTPYACTDIDILWFDNATNGATWQYSVDGGTAVTITCANAGYIKRIQLNGLANTTHTIVIKNQSADFVALPVGCATYISRTSGIGYALLAGYGEELHKGWGVSTGKPTDRFSQLQGNGAATTGFGYPTQPSLAIIELIVNDCNVGNSKIEYFDELRKMVQALRRGVSNCSILLLIPCNPDAVNSDITNGNFGNSQDYASFIQQMYGIAQAYNCAVVNIHALWGETPGAQGFITNGDAHPVDAGHLSIANTLSKIL